MSTQILLLFLFFLVISKCDPEIDSRFDAISFPDLEELSRIEEFLDGFLLPDISEDPEDLDSKFQTLADANVAPILNKSKISGLKVLAKDIKIKSLDVEIEKEITPLLDQAEGNLRKFVNLIGESDPNLGKAEEVSNSIGKDVNAVYELIKTAWRDHRIGKTVILSTHDYFKETLEMEMEYNDVELKDEDREVLRDNMDIMKATLVNIFEGENKSYVLFKDLFLKQTKLESLSKELTPIFQAGELTEEDKKSQIKQVLEKFDGEFEKEHGKRLVDEL